MKRNMKVWFAFLGGAIAWLVHLVVGSVVGEGGCVLEGSWFVFLGVSSVGWALIGTTLAMVAVTVGSGVTAWRIRSSDEESVRFMGRAGFIANLIFLSVILAQATPIAVLLNGC